MASNPFQRKSLGSTFTVVAVEGRLEEFGTWDDENNNSSTTSTAGIPLLPLDISSSSVSPTKGLGSKNELILRRGDIIKILAACNPDGSCRRKVPRRAQRLDTGFLDANVPIHDPDDQSTWWIGTIIKRNKKDTRRLTGRFPQRCVALMTELRAKNLTFRCKMCSRMMQSFTKNTILNDFGITGSANQLFGKQDLCVACGPKILRVVQSVAQSLVKQNSDREILAMLRQIARKKLIHETAQEAYALTPERVPRAPPARRPENLNVNRGTGAPPSVPSPRANNVNVRPSDSPPPVAITSSLGTSTSSSSSPSSPSSNLPQPPQQQQQQRNNNNNRRRTQRSNGRKRNNTPKRTNQYDNALPMVPETSISEISVPEISIPPQKSLEDTLLPGLQVIFKNCCTREGHLTKEHIVRMVQRLAKDHQEAQNFKCTLDTAGVIIQALDSDGNGTIEYQEWSEWIVKFAKKSVQEREQMKGNNDKILKNTVVFLEVICAIATKISSRPDIEILRDSLVAMFQDAMQSDTDGHLWPVDIIAMNDKLSKKFPDIAFVPIMNEQVSETIVQSLDSDGNGSVEMDEFVPWLMKGMSKTKEQRQQFAAQGETFQMLIQFMESMTEVATQMNKQVNRLKPGLTQLFTKYDTTGEGMSSKDIYAMVKDLSTQYTTYANDWNEETSKLIVDALDVDENGTIELNEWVDWMIKGASKSNYIKTKFSNTSDTFQQLAYFLEYMSNIALTLNNGEAEEAAAEAAKNAALAPAAPKVNIVLQQQRDRIKSSQTLRTNVSAFTSLTDDHLFSIIDTMTFEEYDDEDSLIIEQGKVADRIYVVLAGEVAIMAATGEQGWPTEKSRIGQLAVFGVEALYGIENQRYSISGVACDDGVQVLSLKIPGNPMFGEKAQEIIQAGKKAREEAVIAKAGKRLASKFKAGKQ